MKAEKQSKSQRISELERQVAELEAQLIHNYHFADIDLYKAGAKRMKGSGVVISITALGGKKIVSPIMICNGLSTETIEALRSDIRRSFLYATEFKPKGVTVKIRVSEATPIQLNWLVAKCEGKSDDQWYWYFNGLYGYQGEYDYSLDWSRGGPFIEREKIAIDWDHDCWNAAKDGCGWCIDGPTPLIAAMRCYVASKLGDEVDIPEELV